MKMIQLISACGLLALSAYSAVAWTSDQDAPVEPSAAEQPTAADPAAEKARLKAEAKAAKAAATAEKKRLAELTRLYGAGPYPVEIDAYLANKPETLKPLYKTLFVGGERNAVLNYQRLGLAAMEQGHWQDAERAFDGALERIEAIYSDNKEAEAARSTFRKEANKDFKGEPYERSMAFYYRGLLYLRSGDYDNARASFKQAELQDTMSEEESFQSDFAAMNYLTGWTYHCQDSAASAAEAFANATKAQPLLIAPAADANMLMVAELGRGPVKARDGAQSQKLIFQTNDLYAEKEAKFSLPDGNQVPSTLASSVNYQATTRGGRAIDGVMNGKASFKATTDAVSSVATDLAMSQMASGNFGSGTMGMAAAGMLFSMFSSAAKTDADIRAWDGLPDGIALATTKVGSANPVPTVSYWQGTTPVKENVQPMMAGTAGKCSVAWSRSQDVSALPADTPGEDTALAQSMARRKDKQARDKAFRDRLAGL